MIIRISLYSHRIISVLFCSVLLVLTGPAIASSIVLKATDTASPSIGGSDTNNDNRLRAYHAKTHIDGWMKFDLSSLPDDSVITSMTLTLYSELLQSPGSSSMIYRSSHDSWVRGGTGFPTSYDTGYDEALTGLDTGPFPTVTGTPYSFTLNVAAVNWSNDLSDDTLSLVITAETLARATYWHGSDCNATCNLRPELTIEYLAAPSLSCEGFQSPMTNHPVKAKKNRVFPLKMELFDDNFEITGADLVAPPVVQVIFTPENSDPAHDVSGDVLSSGHGSDGNQFVFTDGGIWQFNLNAKSYTAPGLYGVMATSGDESEYIIEPACVTSFQVQ
ncbi:MAG: hypothetical protein ACI9MF_002784 [Gammaproteobacteria bacterium]|jgi:hypothetical protein